MNKFPLLVLVLFPACLAAAPRTAEVRLLGGRPLLHLDGRPVAPVFYAPTHAYGGRWSWEEVPQRNLRNFAAIGFRLFQLDLYFEEAWRTPDGPLDMEMARRQVRGLLEACPDGAVVLRVHVNAPFWWNEAHREECAAYADGPVDERTYGPPFNLEDGDVDRPLRASLASLRWRHEAGERLAEFCRRLSELPEGDAVVGIHVSGGVYGEWHNWGFIDHDPDTSPAMTAYFRSWLTRKYGDDDALRAAWRTDRHTLASATVPDLAEREFTGDGIFRDPERERRVIDYFTAQHEVVAEDIEHFTGIVKRSWPRPLVVGVFYGYLHMTFCRQAAGGHLAVERILNCPTIDYLAAPQSYWGATQQLGGSGNSRGIVESTLLHGKLWLDEVDNGGLQEKTAVDPVRNSGKYDPRYVPVIERSALLPLLRGGGLWFYDFGLRHSFGWWDHPVYLERIRRVKKVFDQQIGRPASGAADVLFVWDQESLLYVKNRYTAVAYSLLDQAAEDALRAGVSSEHVYLFDLPRVDLNRHRAIVFMNVYRVTPAQRAFILGTVAGGGRTLIWNYLPGYTDGERNNLAFVEELTGFKLARLAPVESPEVRVESADLEYAFQGEVDPMAVIVDHEATTLARLKGTNRVVVARKSGPQAVQVLSTLPLQGTSFFRDLFRAAGCQIYIETGDFIHANAGLLLVHSRDGGRRTVRLRNGTGVPLDLPVAATWLLDAQSGSVILR